MSSLVGRVVLGRYRVLHLLARGGMGEVYLARSEGAAGFFRPVVVKRVLSQHADDKAIVGLFQREARIMSTLRHPNIVSVLDFGLDDRDQVMAIEYVHGFHLGRWLRWTAERQIRFPVERAIEIILEVLDALQHAHEAKAPDGSALQIVHRDVSPANVLVDVEGVVKLADFGIARMEGEHTVVDQGSQPSVKGKFPYLPPEIFEGKLASRATDVYAAAVILDEVLRGKNAFRTGAMAETLGRVFELVPDPLDTVRDDVGADLARIVSRALAKDPEKRFSTAAELASALRSVRKSSPDEAKRELAEATRREFLDPAIGAFLDVPDLSDLEALWHGPAPEPAPAQDDPLEGRPRSSRPTMPTRRVDRGAAGGRGAARLVALLGLVTVLGLAAAGAWWVSQPPPLEGGGPVFVVVDHAARPDAATATATAVDAAAPDAVADAGATAEPSRPDAGRRSTPSRSVEAPFRARSADIGRCFTTHVRELEGTPEIVVHFAVRADGTVEHASLAPAELAPTALGRCLLDVASSTRFAAGDEPVSFRVPLGARRVGGD